MTRLVRAELLKLRTTRLWWGLLLGAVLLTGFAAIATLAVQNTPQAAQNGVTPVRTAGDVADFIAIGTVGAFFALVLGVTVATGEHRYGTVGATYLAVPRRYRVVIAKLACGVLAGALFSSVTTVTALVIVWAKFLIDGAALPTSSIVAARFFAMVVLGAYAGGMGAGVGTAARSQLVAILGVLGFRLILEPLAGSLSGTLGAWTPFAGTEQALTQSRTGALHPSAAMLLMLGYVAAVSWTGIWLEQRRDV